ncbi:23S rRNA (uracil(1939)-C(5))-methyltransferase RlmD [Thermanaerosceptrum fracticalcis]|uniref:23S rRNA (Uracil(1939)-C(5))-methyltransferase RlmD n=1 Tax=Thermanaerosceptrum fracticalcis TaxID=1712410 RepID=A0A7G6E6K1_THEFR|nr:23S rRNA (uracil(1939)-C(5))-methyltransferase RlmD [Thermanaerosceptrum fracticalcis]QNB47705.1 23S rRNA (uracil(1939)-C(5))-methyltransferase RlmD [Thermanaerosceptrum fracticalcis]
MQKQNKVYKVTITGYSHEGAGVGRVGEQVIFVPGALLDEEVLVEITERHKRFLKGRVLEVIKKHGQRLTPPCEVYASCGGCQLQHIAYQGQLEIKERIVKEALTRIGGLDGVPVQPVLGMKNPWAYRNKGHFRVGISQGKVKLGFVEEGSHDLVSQYCQHLFSPQVTALISSIEDILTDYKVKVATKEEKGLRHVVIRESKATGEILVVFIISGEFSAHKEMIAREICHKTPAVVGICQNFNPKPVGEVMGKKTTVLSGKGEIEDRIGSFTFTISPRSFFQVNNIQTEVLYEKALAYAGLSGKETVIDAYCGIGTISLFLAQKAQKVMGIEYVAEAVKDAQLNAQRNDVNNVQFLQGEAEVLIPQLVKKGVEPDVVVVDPPRKGCDPRLLESIIAVKPERVVYVSCNPATLARDLKYLTTGGYQVQEVQPVDMFPWTAHVECIIQIKRAESRMK